MWMKRILSQEGGNLKVSGLFFKAVVQAVLPRYVVPDPQMEQALSSFQHRVVQRLNRGHKSCRVQGRWEYLPLEEVMEEAGFEKIGVYITRSKNMVVQYITTQSIMDLCEVSVQSIGSWVSWWWWDKEGINLQGANDIPATESEIEEDKCGAGSAQEDMPGRNRRQGILQQ